MPVPAIAAAAVPVVKGLIAKVATKEAAKQILQKFGMFVAKNAAISAAIGLATKVAGGGEEKQVADAQPKK